MALGILNDLTRCTGCEACVAACREINEAQEEPTSRLSASTWTVIERHGVINIKRQCMHCVDPACASVCPVAALKKTPEGPVTYDESRCIGCRYCMVACPFSVPKYEWTRALPRIRKCIFCAQKRLARGEAPACTSVCPSKATVFGEREALIREARQRIRSQPGRYVDHIYGLKEAGGTSVLYLSAVPFETLGFPTGIEEQPYPKLTWQVLSKIPDIASVGGVMMYGLWWIVNRRIQLSDGEHGDGNDRVTVEEVV